jgi:ribonuclease P protein component
VTYLYLTGEDTPARAGLIISKSAGGSVIRHSIARRLRHALNDHLTNLPLGALLVVRALSSSNRGDLRLELSEAISVLIKKSKVSQ